MIEQSDEPAPGASKISREESAGRKKPGRKPALQKYARKVAEAEEAEAASTGGLEHAVEQEAKAVGAVPKPALSRRVRRPNLGERTANYL